MENKTEGFNGNKCDGAIWKRVLAESVNLAKATNSLLKVLNTVYPCLTAILFFWVFTNVYHSACVWPRALKLGCVTNFNMLFLVMGFISLVDEIQFMLISSRHICIRSMTAHIFAKGL